MNTVKVNLKQNPYKIIVGKHILSRTGSILKSLKIGVDAVVITNPKIRKLHGKTIISSLKRSGMSVKVIEVPDGERSKSTKVAIRLIEQIAKYDVKRQLFVVAFGGGVIGDLAGFVAAVYRRGIPFVQIPTTMLAQIDSAIGGKVAVDLAVGKNLVGAFYQPKIVLSDVELLKTLDRKQILNGLSEAVKYGIIKDKKLFDYICNNRAGIFSANGTVLKKIVLECSRIKANVVASDEKEVKGIRTILNFGHTIGHAIEAACKYNAYSHGEAVALGMRVAIEISRRLNLVTRITANKMDQSLTDVGLPTKIRKVSVKDTLRVMEHDKKFQKGKNRFVLVTRIGKVKVVTGIPIPIIKKSIEMFKG